MYITDRKRRGSEPRLPDFQAQLEVLTLIYILLATGFEETEMIAPLDMLRRADIPVQTVGMSGKVVMGAHNIPVTADILSEEVDCSALDGVILPGGMPGTTNLQSSDFVIDLVKTCYENGKLVAAICAAPMILGELELLDGKNATCFPGFEEHLKGATILSAPAVTDGNVITGRGAGAALDFGAALVDYLTEPGKGAALLAQMQDPRYV